MKGFFIQDRLGIVRDIVSRLFVAVSLRIVFMLYHPIIV